LYRTRDRDLPGNVREMEQEAGFRVRQQILPLAAFIVRKELDLSTDPASIEHRPRPGCSVFAHSCEGHRLGLRRAKRGPFGLPSLKDVERVCDRGVVDGFAHGLSPPPIPWNA